MKLPKDETLLNVFSDDEPPLWYYDPHPRIGKADSTYSSELGRDSPIMSNLAHRMSNLDTQTADSDHGYKNELDKGE